MKFSINECIKIISLYLTDYINQDQFIELFFSNYDDFETALRDDIFWDIIDTNFTHEHTLNFYALVEADQVQNRQLSLNIIFTQDEL